MPTGIPDHDGDHPAAGCEACTDLLTTEFLADALLVADRRNINPKDVVNFAIWWFHDSGHPHGKWHPTGAVDMPMVHSA